MHQGKKELSALNSGCRTQTSLGGDDAGSDHTAAHWWWNEEALGTKIRKCTHREYLANGRCINILFAITCFRAERLH